MFSIELHYRILKKKKKKLLRLPYFNITVIFDQINVLVKSQNIKKLLTWFSVFDCISCGYDNDELSSNYMK